MVTIAKGVLRQAPCKRKGARRIEGWTRFEEWSAVASNAESSQKPESVLPGMVAGTARLASCQDNYSTGYPKKLVDHLKHFAQSEPETYVELGYELDTGPRRRRTISGCTARRRVTEIEATQPAAGWITLQSSGSPLFGTRKHKGEVRYLDCSLHERWRFLNIFSSFVTDER